jgi:hypothetical protein
MNNGQKNLIEKIKECGIILKIFNPIIKKRTCLVGAINGRIDAGDGKVLCRYQEINIDGFPVTMFLVANLNGFPAIYDLPVIVEWNRGEWKIIGVQKTGQ